MASRKKDRSAKKQRAYLEGEVAKLAQQIADVKEYAAWAYFELEKYTFRARNDRTRLQGLRVGALGMEDVNERSKVNAEITGIEREIGDVLFKLAQKRIVLRRKTNTIKEHEEMLLTVKKALEEIGKR